MMKLRELIKRVRGCKTIEEERSVINKESAEMRSMKTSNDLIKCRNLAKCIFIHMLGFETNFIQMTCVNLLSSSNFTEKRIAYVALCVLMDEKCEVLLLTTSTIKKDLESPNQYIKAIALNAIGEVCNPFMCRELGPEIIKLINDPNAYIKKKAALACLKVIRKCPEFIDSISDKLSTFFEDKNHGVLICGLSLIIQVFKQDESYIEKYRKYLKNMIRYLRNLIQTNYAPGYDINGVVDPFLQVKLLEVLTFFGQENEEAAEEMNDLLATISTNTDSSKPTGNAVLYELVRTIIKIKSNSGLKSLGSNILGKFLSHKDNNYKYIALNTLQEVAKTDINSVQKHKTTILECLKDNDVSVKRRALDLTYVIINTSNIKVIVKELLNFLLVAENEFKLELTTKLTQSLEKYSPSIKWQIDTLIKMLTLSANYVSEESISSIINLVVSASELQIYAIHKLYIAMENNLGQEALVKVGIYLIGEFALLLINNTAQGPDGEVIVVKENNIIELIEEVNNRKYSNSTVKEFTLNCLVKLSTKLSNNSINQIKNMIEGERTSYYSEVQQRAVEYSVFNSIDTDTKQKIAYNVPNMKNYGEDLSNKAIVDEDDNNEVGDIKLDPNSMINNSASNRDNVNSNINIDKTTNFNKNESSSNTNNIFDDIFNTGKNSTNINSNPSENNIMDGLDSIIGSNNNYNNNANDIFGNNTQNNNMNSLFESTKNNNNDNFNIDFFSGNNSNNNNNNMKESNIDMGKTVINGNDIQVNYITQKKSDSEYNVKYILNNKASSNITNIKLAILAVNYIKVTINGNSGNSLSSNQINGIQKDISIVNSDTSKNIKLKLKLNYTINNEEKNEIVTQTDFSN